MRLTRRLFTFSVLAIFLGSLGGFIRSPEPALAQTADPVFVGAGDITNCSGTQDESTAKLLDNIAGTVFALGDNAYPDGTLTDYNNCYGPTWGRHKSRTRPIPGNHDYHTVGAPGYYTYFGAAASPLDTNCTSNCKGYYSYNLGSWHIIALNSEIDHATGSVQEQWLRADLAGNQSMCTLAYWHKPRFSSGANHGSDSSFQPFWQALYDYGADVVLNGHDHEYERFAPQSPTAQAEPTRGIREFVVGTGGAGLYSFSTAQPNSEVRNNTTFGVLKLTLHATSYDWQFVPIAGQTFTDSGSGNCVSAGPAPTVTRTPTATRTSAPGPTATRTSTPTATRTSTPGPTTTRTSTPTVTRTPTLGPSITPTRTTTNTPNASDLIFADGFESGSFSAWSSASTGAGDLSVTASAALVGSRGMQVTINDTTAMYTIDDRPNAEPHYRVRFYFDPNSLSMIDGNTHYILSGYDTSSVFNVEFRFSGGSYQIRLRQQNDSQGTLSTAFATISDASHFIEIEWLAATAAGANNGSVTLWIDGVQTGSLTGLDNDTRRIEQVRLGAVSGIDSGTLGTYYLDAFESRKQSYIGPANSAPTPPAPTATLTLVSTATNAPLSTPTRTPTRTNTPLVTTTRTPTSTSTRTPTPTSTIMHIGDLDGSNSLQNGGWTAIVTFTVHDANHNLVANATVSGTWSNGASGTASCTTGSNGRCSVSISDVSKGQSSVTFTVNNITRVASTYASANNHDPDGDSNGIMIVIAKP